MTETPNPRRVWLLRFLALFVPFLSLFLLWRSPRSVMRKIIYTFGLIFYGIVYLGVIALLLVKFGGAQMDWRGGYIPILTWNKTHTDLEALNRSRATQTNATPTTQPTTAPPYWTGSWSKSRRHLRRATHSDQLAARRPQAFVETTLRWRLFLFCHR